MSLYQEVQTLVEKSKVEKKAKVKELIDKNSEYLTTYVKREAEKGITKTYFYFLFSKEVDSNDVLHFLKELFPSPFKVEIYYAVGVGIYISIDWSTDKPAVKGVDPQRTNDQYCLIYL